MPEGWFPLAIANMLHADRTMVTGSGESGQRAPKPRLLSLGRNAEVDVVLEPLIGVHVPRLEVCLTVLSGFEGEWVDVRNAIPLRLTVLVNAVVA